jgi:hypothetical protein
MLSNLGLLPSIRGGRKSVQLCQPEQRSPLKLV